MTQAARYGPLGPPDRWGAAAGPTLGGMESAGTASTWQHAATTPAATIAAEMRTADGGLSAAEAARRLTETGPNAVPARRASALRVIGGQLASPILVLLAVTALASLATGDATDATIILVILAASVGIGFGNEYKAQRTAQALQNGIAHRAVFERDGTPVEILVADVVPGDVVHLRLGHVVPADVRLTRVAGLACDESALTGESVAVEKSVEPVTGTPGLADLTCCALMGTVVQSGSGLGVVFATGKDRRSGASPPP